jgi:pimeloyl-ACP methyl ester carboxylesterase
MPEILHRPNVVLVHGAWADGSSWNDVIAPLLRDGLNVLAAPLPLTSLSDDIAALERALERTDGPVVRVAHAYAGAVIAAAISERVRSLVFIAALAPDEGETVAEMFYREKPHPQAPQLAPDARGFIWMPHEGFGSAFAQHASVERAALLAATQRADCGRLHSREGAKTRLEGQAVLVPPRGGGPDDQPGVAALYGTPNESAHPVGEGRSYAIGYRPGAGRRIDP